MTSKHLPIPVPTTTAPLLYIREFLDAADSGSSANINASVANGEGTLKISDGHATITLDFPMYTEELRTASLAKLSILSLAMATFSKRVQLPEVPW